MNKSLSFIIFVLIFGCNDQISDSLTSGGSSDPISTPVTNGIGVSMEKPDYLSYYIHEIGETDEDCVINGNFSAITPMSVDCFVEAEELDLYLNGLSFKFEATAGKCDYIGFFPYYFYRFQPGNTGITSTLNPNPKNVTKVVCASGCEATCDTSFPATWNGAALPTAGTYYSVDGTTFFTEAAMAASGNPRMHVCEFDYSDLEPAGPNCDDGEYSTTTYTFSFDSTGGVCSATAPSVSSPITTQCNGNPRACIDGPIREFFSDRDIEENFVTYEVIDTEGEDFEKTYDISSPFSLGHVTNMYAANYTKQCGGTAPNDYDPDVIEQYAAGTDLFDADFTAADPFYVENGTNPMYTFYCLNRALEVKARVRIMVRDWNIGHDDDVIDDRVPGSDFLTEILKNGNENAVSPFDAMDHDDNETIFSPIIPYGDRRDWDDTINLNTDAAGDGCTMNPITLPYFGGDMGGDGNGVFPGNSL
ncbi:MAG: hypothetical protein JNM93_11285 [Bacteriovoracaceae bacterium]|nr:hypothetical protein [Bacteriovoracaceae bacterium]